jgi:hypothetical protein
MSIVPRRGGRSREETPETTVFMSVELYASCKAHPHSRSHWVHTFIGRHSLRAQRHQVLSSLMRMQWEADEVPSLTKRNMGYRHTTMVFLFLVFFSLFFLLFICAYKAWVISRQCLMRRRELGMSMRVICFLLAYSNCTKGFHCDVSMHAYNVLW